MPATGRVRRELTLRGVVQGVGLRPWAARRARELKLAGSVRNEADAVRVSLEGAPADVTRWLDALRNRPPPGLDLASMETATRPLVGERDFAIAESRSSARSQGHLTALPPDVPICEACIGEIFDPAKRRHRYAFTHCTECGPRASVLRALPYDRERTTLAAFPPCEDCAREYADPDDRRHHAQTIACPACGPTLHAERDGRELDGDPVERAAEELEGGGIVALKGYGGYHLLVDATREDAVARLRQRKGRPTRPLAVMVAGLDAARAQTELGPADECLLGGPDRAVVVAARRNAQPSGVRIAPGVAPGLGDLGLLLPFAPLHWLLLYGPGRRPGSGSRFPALVFTSANRSGEPTLHDDREASEALAGLADLIVRHDRDVARPSDDPVFRTSQRGPIPIRLSRSTSPRILRLPGGLHTEVPILALGGDLKCAPALAFGDELLLAEHVGDLENASTADAFASRLTALCDLFGVKSEIAACDRHPDSIGAAWAREVGLQRLPVQHHHAHAASCLVENGSVGPALAWVLDGAGWGPDESVWGGELLHVERGLAGARRLAHLERVPLPGGDAAAREPWRMAAVWLERALAGDTVELPWHARRDPERTATLLDLARRRVASPWTSSCGRLFDAVSSLLDGPDVASFEGEAAMRLESLAAQHQAAMSPGTTWRPEIGPDGPFEVPLADLVGDVVRGRASGTSPPALAARFHVGLATRLARTAGRFAETHGLDTVALSGGCLQNRILLDALAGALEDEGLRPLFHRRVPPGDGGLAVGQAAVALASRSDRGNEALRHPAGARS